MTRTCYSQAEILGFKDAPAAQTRPSQKTAEFSGKTQMQQCELAAKTDAPLVSTAALVAALCSAGSAPVTQGEVSNTSGNLSSRLLSGRSTETGAQNGFL